MQVAPIAGHTGPSRSSALLKSLVFLLLLSLTAVRAAAVEPAGAISPAAECDRVRAKEPPRNHRPDAQATVALGACISEAFYYGIGVARDYVRARDCAFLERDRGDELVFGGSAILMMIYANGKDVPVDSELAIHFACAIDSSPLELQGRIQHLRRMADAPKPGGFDLCDDATSGFMVGHCAAHRLRIAQGGHAARLGALSAGWSVPQREALKSLVDAAGAYFGSRSNNEVDQQGTNRAAAQVEEELALWDAFIGSLEQMSSGELPHFSRAEFEKADGALNATFAQLQRRVGPTWGTVTFRGIRDSQRKWLKYRNAFVTFGRQKYPRVTDDSWKTWLTRSRLSMLRAFLD